MDYRIVDYGQLTLALDILLPSAHIDFRRTLGLADPGLPFLRFGAAVGRVSAREVVAMELERVKAGDELNDWETEFALGLSPQLGELQYRYLSPDEWVSGQVLLGWRLAAVAAALDRPTYDDWTFDVASFLASWPDLGDAESGIIVADPSRPSVYRAELEAAVAERRGLDLNAVRSSNR